MLPTHQVPNTSSPLRKLPTSCELPCMYLVLSTRVYSQGIPSLPYISGIGMANQLALWPGVNPINWLYRIDPWGPEDLSSKVPFFKIIKSSN